MPKWLGIFYAILLGAAVLCQTLFSQAYFNRVYVIGLRFRSAITGLVYRKVGFVYYTSLNKKQQLEKLSI
jgi:hypothetical protein